MVTAFALVLLFSKSEYHPPASSHGIYLETTATLSIITRPTQQHLILIITTHPPANTSSVGSCIERFCFDTEFPGTDGVLVFGFAIRYPLDSISRPILAHASRSHGIILSRNSVLRVCFFENHLHGKAMYNLLSTSRYRPGWRPIGA